METWRYLLWLSGHAADGLRWAWPVSLVFGSLLLAALCIDVARRKQPPPAGWAWQLGVLLNPPFILALGAAWACEACTPSALGGGVRHTWAMRSADVAGIAQFLSAAWWVWRSVGWRLTTAAFHAFAMWCTLWAAFMAGMSMSGDWL